MGPSVSLMSSQSALSSQVPRGIHMWQEAQDEHGPVSFGDRPVGSWEEEKQVDGDEEY